jgi:predicted house-cleaning noncanonical NTP pyrophosphatase (MazG superfamily)
MEEGMTTGKLVRDGIPEIMRSDGLDPQVEVLGDAAFEKALRAKLLEEANEFLSDGRIEELADLLEVIGALAERRGASMDELERLRLEKRARRGGFGERFFLKTR